MCEDRSGELELRGANHLHEPKRGGVAVRLEEARNGVSAMVMKSAEWRVWFGYLVNL